MLLPLPALALIVATTTPDLGACVTHSDCGVGAPWWVPAPPLAGCDGPTAARDPVNTAAWRRFVEDVRERCPAWARSEAEASSKPPPIAATATTTHHACVAHRCTVMPGAMPTRDEEDEARRGVDSPAWPFDVATLAAVAPGGACYDDGDCVVDDVDLTHFPRGVGTGRGALCPVCPRPGRRLPDEDARVAALLAPGVGGLPACPPLHCRPRSASCQQRRCVVDARPVRPERRPLPVARFAPPPAPDDDVRALATEPDEEPMTPWPPDTRPCRRDNECVVVTCACARTVSHRADAAVACDAFVGMPCAHTDAEVLPSLTATCVDQRCVSTATRDAHREGLRQAERFRRARADAQEVIRRYEARLRAIAADLERHAEREAP